jgi:hypothetical protein
MAFGLLGLPWADGDGMTGPMPQLPGDLNQTAATILEPEVFAGGTKAGCNVSLRQ